jgi:hypothetical protein
MAQLCTLSVCSPPSSYQQHGTLAPHHPPSLQSLSRTEHNQAQAAVFDRPEIVEEFTQPLPPEIEQVRLGKEGGVRGQG